MKSCGVVVTHMTRQDWQGQKFWIKLRTMLFNLCLFIYQMVLMVVGTAYGKFKWEKRGITLVEIIVAMIFAMSMMIRWWNIPILIIWGFITTAILRNIPWRRVWRAAQASHVRLCLEKVHYRRLDEFGVEEIELREAWVYINFGYPKAEMQYWRPANIDNKRFRYFKPTFSPSDEFIEAMIQYAYDQVGKRYDELQLISNGLHLIAWIVWPWCWGKELKVIKMFNRKGGREHCISGVTACLRDAEWRADQGPIEMPTDKVLKIIMKMVQRTISKFFKGYSTATTSPCLVPLSKNWREK